MHNLQHQAMIRNIYRTAIALTVLHCTAWLMAQANAAPPNIVVILTDDQGYADISLNPRHPREVATPHMDALAKDGVVFSQAYTSGHVCSPTRAGLMLGEYQQRVGVYTAGDGGRGFDPTMKIFPSFLPDEYVSTAIGKWHLGLDEDYPELKWHALNRGFDECYKFMGRGGHSYFDLRSDSAGKFAGPIYRNKERINDEGYLTNRLSEEAVAFIDRHKAKPFFLYLAYNAVHAPAEAPEEDIKAYQAKFPGLSKQRAVLMAMLKHLDDGVGDVVGKLKQEGLFDNTIVFFLTDNGGSKAMSADNSPLRGFKGSLEEGGIRTPFIVSWPAKFAGGRTVDTPIISLDILPTALDALGKLPAENHFDGKSLLPLLTGQSTTQHPALYWSNGPEGEWAVRRGAWKLRSDHGRLELFNLRDDPSEAANLAAETPAMANSLRDAFDQWIEPMAAPITGGEKRTDVKAVAVPLTEREKKRERLRLERKQQREAEKKSQETDAAVDSKTLTGKVMCGYQGWFNCEGDGAGLGWTHWARQSRQPFGPGNVTVDLWPDVSEFDADERYATGFRHADGSIAEVFSSANRKTVLRHLQWMRDYGIDGAFLQRFANGLSSAELIGHKNRVLSHVREGAKESGRCYAVMYDLSGLRAGRVSRVVDDWRMLREALKITDDAAYLHHEGKPIVAVWGIGFNDGRNYSLAECRDLVASLKADGCTVMLGLPTWWREGKRDATNDPMLLETIQLADVISPWTVGRYRTPQQATEHGQRVWRADATWCAEYELDLLPVVFPGFSWHNLHGDELNSIPRLKGEFLWSQMVAAKRAGCEMIYVAMFDEVDEGTAIFKCTNDPPIGDGAEFISYEGLPSDHYLRLVGKGAKMLRGELPIKATLAD